MKYRQPHVGQSYQLNFYWFASDIDPLVSELSALMVLVSITSDPRKIRDRLLPIYLCNVIHITDIFGLYEIHFFRILITEECQTAELIKCLLMFRISIF